MSELKSDPRLELRVEKLEDPGSQTEPGAPAESGGKAPVLFSSGSASTDPETRDRPLRKEQQRSRQVGIYVTAAYMKNKNERRVEREYNAALWDGVAVGVDFMDFAYV